MDWEIVLVSLDMVIYLQVLKKLLKDEVISRARISSEVCA